MKVKAHKRSKRSSTRLAASTTSQAVIGTGGRTWPRKLKRLLINRYMIVFMVGFLFVALVGGGAAIYTRHERQIAEQDRQRQEILTAAAPNLFNADPRKLDQTIEKIKQQPNYETNPNYLYVLLTYYIGLSDAQNARLYYDKLAAVYDPNVGFDSSIVSVTLSMSDLEQRVQSLERQAKTIETSPEAQQ